MTDRSPKGANLKPLLIAGALETLCIVAGIAAYLYTDKLIWIFIGLLAGAGFSLPAVIKFYREAKERDDASR